MAYLLAQVGEHVAILFLTIWGTWSRLPWLPGYKDGDCSDYENQSDQLRTGRSWEGKEERRRKRWSVTVDAADADSHNVEEEIFKNYF